MRKKMKHMNEQDYKRTFQTKLLNFLLEKYENSKAFREGVVSKQRPQFALKNNNPFQKDYDDEMDFRKRDWMNEVLIQLEEQKVVALSWGKFKEGRELAKVYLNIDAVQHAYHIAQREPLLNKMEVIIKILLPLREHPWSWVRLWAEQKINSLSNRKTGLLDLDNPKSYQDLVVVLNYLSKINGNVLKRVMSQTLFADSKYFEKHVEKRLINALKSRSEFEFKTNEEALAYIGIVHHSQMLLIAGDVRFDINGSQFVIAPFKGGIGLSTETVKNLKITDIPVKRIILIENLTSFEQWSSQRAQENEVVIYTGGFPHRTVQVFLAKLNRFLHEQEHEIEVCHWGDIDLGGIRIFKHLKDHYFPTLHPIMMDQKTLLTYKDHAAKLTKNYESKVALMLNDEQFEFWHPIIKIMLQENIRLEQETITEIKV